MINFICKKISDYMEPNQPGNWVCPLSPSHDQSHIIAIEADQPIERDRMFFWACAHLGILQKKRIKIQVKKVNNQRLYRPYDYIDLQKSGGLGGLQSPLSPQIFFSKINLLSISFQASLKLLVTLLLFTSCLMRNLSFTMIIATLKKNLS